MAIEELGNDPKAESFRELIIILCKIKFIGKFLASVPIYRNRINLKVIP